MPLGIAAPLPGEQMPAPARAWVVSRRGKLLAPMLVAMLVALALPSRRVRMLVRMPVLAPATPHQCQPQHPPPHRLPGQLQPHPQHLRPLRAATVLVAAPEMMPTPPQAAQHQAMHHQVKVLPPVVKEALVRQTRRNTRRPMARRRLSSTS